MVTFIIIRHGFSEGNKEKRFSGQLDILLDQAGALQAKCVAKYIVENFDVDSIYSSDLSRAYETVKPLADELGIEVIKEEKLREIDVGKWQGVLIETVKENFPKEFELYRNNPGVLKFIDGESYEDAMHRGSSVIEKIAQENDGKTVVVGTHGGVIRALHAKWDGASLEKIKDIPIVPNASISVATYDNGKVSWQQIGYVGHLTDKTNEDAIK